MNTVLFFIMILLSLFFSSVVIPMDNSFYSSLNLPPLTPPNWVFSVVWIIIYILIAVSTTIIFTKYDFSNRSRKYWLTFAINFLFNQVFSFVFFNVQSLLLSFIVVLIVFLTAIALYKQTKILNSLAAKLLIPYLIWLVVALYLSLGILILN